MNLVDYMMRGNTFTYVSIVLFVLNLIFLLFIITFRKIEWLNNNIVQVSWCLDVGIMFYYIVVGVMSCINKKNVNNNGNRNNTNNNINCCHLLIFFFLLFLLLAAFYASILSFYAIYYSFKGETFFYYYCYDLLENFRKLFIGYYSIKSNFEYELAYYYFKIYLKKGNSGIFILALLMRMIMFIWNITTIFNILYFSKLMG